MRDISTSPYRPPFQSPSPPPEREPELELPAPSSKAYQDELRAMGATTPPNAWVARAERIAELAQNRAPRASSYMWAERPSSVRQYHPYR